MMEKEIARTIETLIMAFGYNMETHDLLDAVHNIIDEIETSKQGITKNQLRDIMMSFIVLKYGDYGTSPRSGWFPKIERNIILEALKHCEKEIKEIMYD